MATVKKEGSREKPKSDGASQKEVEQLLGATVRVRIQACGDEKSLVGYELSLERTPGTVPRWGLSLKKACALWRAL